MATDFHNDFQKENKTWKYVVLFFNLLIYFSIFHTLFKEDEDDDDYDDDVWSLGLSINNNNYDLKMPALNL